MITRSESGPTLSSHGALIPPPLLAVVCTYLILSGAVTSLSAAFACLDALPLYAGGAPDPLPSGLVAFGLLGVIGGWQLAQARPAAIATVACYCLLQSAVVVCGKVALDSGLPAATGTLFAALFALFYLTWPPVRAFLGRAR